MATMSLVDVLSQCANIDTSVARRVIVEGRVKVDDRVVDDPAARLPNEHGLPSFVKFDEKLYPIYP
ncbi:MAG: hypothetical protein EBT15_08665 [Betaproteobacteria bacterium]|nr:hypothetical protein [Betaproteobacteria bacterium]